MKNGIHKILKPVSVIDWLNYISSMIPIITINVFYTSMCLYHREVNVKTLALLVIRDNTGLRNLPCLSLIWL